MMKKLEIERSQAKGRQELAAKEVAEDREAWDCFRSSCLTLAEQWLMMNEMKMKANSTMKEKLDVEEQIESLLSERNVRANDMSFSQETVGEDHSVDGRSQAAMLSAVTSKSE